MNQAEEIRKLWAKWRCQSEMTSFCSMLAAGPTFCPGVLLSWSMIYPRDLCGLSIYKWLYDVLMVDSTMIHQGWTSPPKHGFTNHSCFAHCGQAAEWVRKELLLRPTGSRDRCCGWSKHTITQLIIECSSSTGSFSLIVSHKFQSYHIHSLQLL